MYQRDKYIGLSQTSIIKFFCKNSSRFEAVTVATFGKSSIVDDRHNLKYALHKKMKFSIKDFFKKCDQIRYLQIWSHFLKKSLMENFIDPSVNHHHCKISYKNITCISR